MSRLPAANHALRPLLRLAIPAALTQLGAMLLGIVDMIMVGRLGVAELDAAALGNLVAMGTLVFGQGCVLGMDPVAAQAHGAGDGARVGQTLHRGLVIAVLASLPIMGAWTVTSPALRAVGQDGALSAAAGEYLVIQIISVAPFLAFGAQRQYLQARGIVAPALWVVVIANLFNLVANWALIFGHLGCPALGLIGAGIATAASRILQCVLLAAWIKLRRLHVGAWVPLSRDALDPRGLWEILGHGIPVGLQYGLEVWAFQATTLMAGVLGEAPLAAHVIVLNIASMSFMFTLGISIAAATRIGNLIGAGQRDQAQRTAWVALGLAATVMTTSALFFVLARELLPRGFTDEATVIALASGLLPIAAAFQIFDGAQVVGGGILRGMGATAPAAVFNVIGYYALGLPLGGLLAFHAGAGIAGLWWGLCVGLGVVALCLVAFVRLRGPAWVAPVRE